MDREDRNAALKTLQTFEQQRAKIDAVIEALRSLLDLPANGARQLALTETAVVTPIKTGRTAPYARMPVLRAAIAYLTAVQKPMTAPQIATALREGGQSSRSRKYTNAVYSRLYTESRRPGGVVERGPDNTWALRAWRKTVA